MAHGRDGGQRDAATIALVGLSHHTAPIELRERVYVDAASIRPTVREVMESPAVDECVVLSTCNRTELYLHAADPASAEAVAIGAIAARAGMSPSEVEAYLYHRHGHEGVLHLFRVAAGLDSLVVGEAEILGQVGDAYELGLSLPDTVGPVLHRLFQSAQAVGGAVRSETSLGRGAASIPSAAVRLAAKVFGSLEGKSAMVLGAGEMGITTLRCLLSEGISDVLVANRTLDRARETVAQIGGRAISLEAVWEAIFDVDILVTSTSAAEPVVTRDKLATSREQVGSPLVVLDIALPRDVEPDVGALPGIFLYNIDDLQKVVGATEEARRAEAAPAEALATDHATRFWRWYRAREVGPLIRGLRAHGEAVRVAELERLLAGLDGLNESDRERIETTTRRLLNKLLHPSTVALRQAAADPNAIEFLDRLREEITLAVGSPRPAGVMDEEIESSGAANGPADAKSEESNEARG
ncbi:MAG: glutamyl-tRNA reductase [Gemmatimonadales bacterium]